MRKIIVLCAALVATSAEAQSDKMKEGLYLFREGAKRLLEGLQDEVQPALEGLQSWLDNIDLYELPEVLPNGDIIIRRKTPLEPEDGPAEEGGAPIDL